MPKLDLAYGKPARQYLLDCAQYWLRMGVDGFRLDYAHGPEQDFWVDFRKACTQINSEVWTFGEIVEPPDVQRTYAGGLWGSLDFLLCQVLRQTFGAHTMSLEQFAAFITSHERFFTDDLSLPSFIDNHDMNRFFYLAGNDERTLKLTLLVLYSLPGPPIIYYGTKVPLSQHQSIHANGALGFDEARLAMPWEVIEKSPFPDYLRRLSEMRKKNPIVHQYTWHLIQSDVQKDTIVFGKAGSSDTYLLINRSDKTAQVSIPADGQGQYIDLIGEEIYRVEKGDLHLTLPPVSAMLLSAI